MVFPTESKKYLVWKRSDNIFFFDQVAINSVHALDRFLFRANLKTGNVSTISIPKADQNGKDYVDLPLTLNASATYQALDLLTLENVAIPVNGFR